MLLRATAVAVATAAVLLALWWAETEPGKSESQYAWAPEDVFQKLDVDRNGHLDRLEFARLREAINQVQSHGKEDDKVVIKCLFTPLVLSSMENDLSMAGMAVKGLIDWNEPLRHQASYSPEIFEKLIQNGNDEVGSVWYLIQPEVDSLYEDKFTNFRYSEELPTVPGPGLTFYHLLSMFHENVFLQTRFHPRGTVATLQAKTSNLLLISFRCHAEFQLNNPPLLPFWFTPAQFRGQIIVQQDGSDVLYFNLEVPSSRKLNVDMEWMNTQNSSLEVDIGYLPQMKLELKDQQMTPSAVDWEQRISDEAVNEILEKAMFSFKEVKYYPIKEAVKLSKETEKPLHCIVLWGALDDQSC